MTKNQISEWNIFLCLLLAHLAYVWVMPVFVTQDGPIHLYNASVFRDFILHNDEGYYSGFFRLNLQLFPNWVSTITLSLLLTFLTPVVTEKVFISLLVIGLPLAVRYALKQLNPAAVYLSSIVFLISNGYFLMYGFYNFQLSLVLFFWFIGLYIKYKETFSIKQVFLLTFLALLIFFTHPVALVILCAMVGMDIVFRFPEIIKKKEERMKILYKAGKSAFCIVPAAVLFSIYFLSQPDNGVPLIELKIFSFHYWGYLIFPVVFKVFSDKENYVFILFSVMLFIHFIYLFKSWKKQGMKKNTWLLIGVIVLLLVMYFFISDTMAGGGLLTVRLGALVYLFFILLAGLSHYDTKLKWFTVAFSTLLSVSLLFLRFPIQRRVGELTAQYIEIGSKLPEKSTILAMGYSNRGEIGADILCPGLELFGGIGGYLGVNRHIISVQNSEADTDYFPIRLMDATNPFHYLSGHLNYMDGLGSNPPVVYLTEYNKRKDCKIDFVILWGDDSRLKAMKEYNDFQLQLKESYGLYYESEDHLTRIYKWSH